MGKMNNARRGWLDYVDGWISTKSVRRDLMWTLVVILLAIVIIVALLTGVIGVIADHLLPTLGARLIAAGTVAALGGGTLAARRALRARRQFSATASAPGVE